MIYKYLLILIVLIPLRGWSQQKLSIKLSPNHLNKLRSINDNRKRIKMYYRFFRSDSIRSLRNEKARFRKLIDSAVRANNEKKHFRNRILKKSTISDREEFNSLIKQLLHRTAMVKDSITTDSLESIASQYGLHAMKVDSLFKLDTIFHSFKGLRVDELDSLNGLLDFTDADGNPVIGDPGALPANLEGWSTLKDANTIGDKSYSLDSYTKAIAPADQIRDLFEGHAEKLISAQNKMSKLLNKYREFADSEDLEHAKKRNSLNGKTFLEHLVLGVNFNVISIKPFSIDASSQIGYKFSSRFNIGAGINVRSSGSDTINNNLYISPAHLSYRGFAQWDAIRNIFVWGEYENARLKLPGKENSERTSQHNYFIGLGRKFLIHPKVYMTITGMYNVNAEDNPVYTRRFQVRTGFQLSELAIRKKEIDYDPDR